MAANRFGPFFHALTATVLFIGSVVLVGMGHSASDTLKKLDFVTLYTYKKAVPDRDKALRNLTAANKAATFWLSDKLDAQHCLDMTYYAYPVAAFTPGLDPTSPTCQISFGVASTATAGQVQISAVYTGNVASCAVGTYPLQVNGGAGVVATTPNLVISAVPSANNGSTQLSFALSVAGTVGFNYATFNAGWTACRDARRELASQYLTNTSCETEASPMCTCVRGFTARLLDWNQKLRYEPAPGVFLEDVLLRGVERCMDLRRAHDVPVPIDGPYARSRPLLLFSLALLLNSLLYALEQPARDMLSPGMAWVPQAVFLAALFLGSLFTCLFDASGGANGEWRTMLTMLLPAFGVHGLYAVIAESVRPYKLSVPAPFLHPVAFDLCLGSLTLFTLVERGVVQSDYLVVEVLKVHAVAALYMGVTWYNRHVGEKVGEVSIFASNYVQQAYLLLWLVALSAAFDTSIVPYPSKKGWELHWALPVAFTFWAFANPAWFHSLPLRTKLGERGGALLHYNDLAGFLAFAFGSVLWGYALRTHIQVYGAQHYAYPSVNDLNLPLATKFLPQGF